MSLWSAHKDRLARRAPRALILAALAQSVLLAGCATAGGQADARPYPPEPYPVAQGPVGGQYDEILSELPHDAPPGECYARVVVPGQPIAAPPQAQGATWVLNPGPPGSPGPIWCLTPTGPAPVMFTPERDGFIRVLCDTDATPVRVERWQRRLKQEGYYQGDYSGRYDAGTAQAVERFQTQRHIRHGGYLSNETVEALEAPLPPPPPVHHAKRAPAHQPTVARPYAPVAAPVYAGHGQAYGQTQTYGQSYSYAGGSAAASAGGVGYAPYPAVATQPAYGYPAYPSYPTYPQAYPAAPQTYAYPQAGYVQQGSTSSSYGTGYQSQSSYSSSSHGGSTYGAYGQGYAQSYPVQTYGYGQSAYGAGQGYGQAYGQSYAQSYGQAAYGQYGYGQAGYAQGACCTGGYGYASQAYTAYGPRPAYAAGPSAIQNGWLTWAGKQQF